MRRFLNQYYYILQESLANFIYVYSGFPTKIVPLGTSSYWYSLGGPCAADFDGAWDKDTEKFGNLYPYSGDILIMQISYIDY